MPVAGIPARRGDGNDVLRGASVFPHCAIEREWLALGALLGMGALALSGGDATLGESAWAADALAVALAMSD